MRNYFKTFAMRNRCYPCAMNTATFLLPLLLFSQLQAQNKSPEKNPCDNPQSQMQMNFCAGFKYEQSDVHLNKVYAKAMQYMRDDLTRAQREEDQNQIKYEETAISNLKEAERAWISYRDIQCKAAEQQYQDGSMAPMIYADCMTTLTDHRIADIKSVYEEGDRKLE